MAYLVHIREKENKEIPLSGNDTTIGRSSDCSIKFPEDGQISRIHCCIQKQADSSYLLIDEASRNGTFLNGKRILHEGVPLKDGDDIRVGNTYLVFRSPPAAPKEMRTEVIFQEMANELGEGKGYSDVLKNIVKKRDSGANPTRSGL